jgi:hypothetical protein
VTLCFQVPPLILTTFQTAAKEALVWRQLRHERVLPLLGLTSHSDHRIGMVSPFMKEGHIGEYVHRRGTLPPDERTQLVRPNPASYLTSLH